MILCVPSVRPNTRAVLAFPSFLGGGGFAAAGCRSVFLWGTNVTFFAVLTSAPRRVKLINVPPVPDDYMRVRWEGGGGGGVERGTRIGLTLSPVFNSQI